MFLVNRISEGAKEAINSMNLTDIIGLVDRAKDWENFVEQSRATTDRKALKFAANLSVIVEYVGYIKSTNKPDLRMWYENIQQVRKS